MKSIVPGFEKVFRTRLRSELREVKGRNIFKVCTATSVVRVMALISVDKAEKKPRVDYFV